MTLASAVLSFAVFAGLLTITPGLDTALVLRAAITGSRRLAFVTGLGVSLGSLTWGVAAAVGVSALLAASHAAYTGLRVVGAAYLIWLGARMLWGALRGGDAVAVDAAGPERLRRAFGRGLLTNLLNPKVGAFYMAVLPQFIPAGASPAAVGALLASVHAAEGMTWFAAIILGAGTFRAVLARRPVQRTVDGVIGGVLVGFGLKLGLSGR